MNIMKKKQAAMTRKKTLTDDIIIPVMGPTGVGKSTFINYLAGENAVKVGHDLRSCTAKLQPVIIPPSQHPLLGGKRLVIVDTPGFDDTYASDSEILSRIASWLATAYSKDMKLYGVIYLHDISLSRMLGTTRKNLEVFQKLCGDGALRSVVLGTTKWGDVYREDGERRTTQLCEQYWKVMLDHGSKVSQFEDSSKSAWAMVGSIIEAKGDQMEVLQIQRELVDALKLLPDTEAGQKLRGDLDQVLKKLKEDLKTHKRDESKRKELDSQIIQISAQIMAMRIPVSQRVMGFLNLGVDKILDKFALTSRVYQPPIAQLGTECRELILLFGESREGKERLLDLLSAKEHDPGIDHNSSAHEVKYWSVAREETFPVVIGTPGFDTSGDTLKVQVQNIWIWLQNSCREDVQVGVIYLKDESASSGFDAASSTNSCPTISSDADATLPATGNLSAFPSGGAQRVGNTDSTRERSSPVVSGSNSSKPSDPIAPAAQRPPFPTAQTACAPIAPTQLASPNDTNAATPPLPSTVLISADSAVAPPERPPSATSDLEVVNGVAAVAVASQERAQSTHESEFSAQAAPPLASSSASLLAQESNPGSSHVHVTDGFGPGRPALSKTPNSQYFTRSSDIPDSITPAAQQLLATTQVTPLSPSTTSPINTNKNVPSLASLDKIVNCQSRESVTNSTDNPPPKAASNIPAAFGNTAAPGNATAAAGNHSVVASNGNAGAVPSAEKPVAPTQHHLLLPKASQLAPPPMANPSTLPPSSVIECFQSSPLAKTTLFATLTTAKEQTSKTDGSDGKVDDSFTEFQSTRDEALKMLKVVRDKALPFDELLQHENNKDKPMSKMGRLGRLLRW